MQSLSQLISDIMNITLLNPAFIESIKVKKLENAESYSEVYRISNASRIKSQEDLADVFYAVKELLIYIAIYIVVFSVSFIHYQLFHALFHGMRNTNHSRIKFLMRFIQLYIIDILMCIGLDMLILITKFIFLGIILTIALLLFRTAEYLINFHFSYLFLITAVLSTYIRLLYPFNREINMILNNSVDIPVRIYWKYVKKNIDLSFSWGFFMIGLNILLFLSRPKHPYHSYFPQLKQSFETFIFILEVSSETVIDSLFIGIFIFCANMYYILVKSYVKLQNFLHKKILEMLEEDLDNFLVDMALLQIHNPVVERARVARSIKRQSERNNAFCAIQKAF